MHTRFAKITEGNSDSGSFDESDGTEYNIRTVSNTLQYNLTLRLDNILSQFVEYKIELIPQIVLYTRVKLKHEFCFDLVILSCGLNDGCVTKISCNINSINEGLNHILNLI